MSINNSTSIHCSAVSKESVTIDTIRPFIAEQLRVSVARVTDEAHLTNDLGADWLDRLELMIAIEDRFAGVEFADDDVYRMEVVGDLISYIENVSQERTLTTHHHVLSAGMRRMAK
jgi:acyl carrier protein